MSEKRFTYDKPLVAFSKGGINDNVTGETYEFTMDTVLDLLNEQQSPISALKDIFKDIITYSEWDSKKPYCSLRIAVDKKTYYKIREILNE